MYRITCLALFCLLLFNGPVFAFESVVLRDTVIRADTTWSGVITIEGVVVVGRGATLSIAPGTVVRFVKIDRDGDGIGDGEIRVLGRIIAVGSKEMPISFQSAELTPMPKDWSYLLIFVSGDSNKIQFCQFRDGFSGLQVQFSTATVTDSLFENNNEGIRFGRAKFSIKNNTIKNNYIGVRFTRMEGPVEIVNNDIYSNKVGIFLVPSGQNIRDFFEPGRGGTAWNRGHLAISQNNIYNNHDYNLKLGAKQVWNLDVANNWWGSDNMTLIRGKIFDKWMDDGLGMAILEPFLHRQFRDLGI